MQITHESYFCQCTQILPQTWAGLIICMQAFWSVHGITWSKVLAGARGSDFVTEEFEFLSYTVKAKNSETEFRSRSLCLICTHCCNFKYLFMYYFLNTLFNNVTIMYLLANGIWFLETMWLPFLHAYSHFIVTEVTYVFFSCYRNFCYCKFSLH